MPRIFVSIGVSPANASSYTDEVEQAIRVAAQGKAVRAIGSCGLDGTADDAQERAFARQIALASELELPVVIEAYDAYDRALDLLVSTGMPAKGAVLRAGDISPNQLDGWVDAGCYISFAPDGMADPVAFCNRARRVPANRILVESGAPAAHLEALAGTDPRADQVVFVADVLQSICPSIQLVENWLTLFA